MLFSVVNTSKHAILLMPPQVQLGGQEKSGKLIKHEHWSTAEQLPVTDFRLSQRRIGPSERADGVVVFERPPYERSMEMLFLQMAESGAVDKPALSPIGFGVSTLREAANHAHRDVRPTHEHGAAVPGIDPECARIDALQVEQGMTDWKTTTLGKTGWKVGRLGLASSYGADERCVQMAFERDASATCIGAQCVLPNSVPDCAACDHVGMSSASLSSPIRVSPQWFRGA